MAYTRESIPDLTGKTAVVTGSNGGLGLETAKALAANGTHVVMAVRNQSKAAAAVEEIRAETRNTSLEVVELDLGSLDSVRAAARRTLAGHDRVDIQVNNAGVMAMPERTTADGFEMQPRHRNDPAAGAARIAGISSAVSAQCPRWFTPRGCAPASRPPRNEQAGNHWPPGSAASR